MSVLDEIIKAAANVAQAATEGASKGADASSEKKKPAPKGGETPVWVWIALAYLVLKGR